MEIFKNNKNVGILATDYIRFKKDITFNWPDINKEKHVVEEISDILAIKNVINHSSVLMRKKFLKEINGYNVTRKNQLDYDLWVRALENNWVIKKLNLPLTAKRIHSEQYFRKKNRIKYLYSSILLQKKVIKILDLPKYYYIFCALKFIYGIIPDKVKNLIFNKGV